MFIFFYIITGFCNCMETRYSVHTSRKFLLITHDMIVRMVWLAENIQITWGCFFFVILGAILFITLLMIY